MLLVRICLGPARGRFAGSGGFSLGFRILDFEFVWDFDIGISDFPFWLRPQAALVFLSCEFVGDLLLRISDFKHAHGAHILHAKTKILIIVSPRSADSLRIEGGSGLRLRVRLRVRVRVK